MIEDDLMKKFKEFPGVNFNFSQLIRDNVEEALSGVKGANSVKLFGSDLQTLEDTGQRVATSWRSPGDPERRACSTSWASPTWRSRSTAKPPAPGTA